MFQTFKQSSGANKTNLSKYLLSKYLVDFNHNAYSLYSRVSNQCHVQLFVPPECSFTIWPYLLGPVVNQSSFIYSQSVNLFCATIHDDDAENPNTGVLIVHNFFLIVFYATIHRDCRRNKIRVLIVNYKKHSYAFSTTIS